MVTNSVAVVTGGSTPWGLEAAMLLGRDHHVVLSDTHAEPLNRALDRLDSHGVSAESIVADPVDPTSTRILMAAAREAGPIAHVVHAGGAHVEADRPGDLIGTRVRGTVTITEATLAVAEPGTTLIHPAADGDQPPLPGVPRWGFRFAPRDPETLTSRLTRLVELGPARLAPAAAAALAEMFVQWYCGRTAARFTARGATLRTVPPSDLAATCRALERAARVAA